MQNEDATLKTLRTFGRTSDLHADIPKGEFKFSLLVLKKCPVLKLKCPRGQKEADFLNLLRSTCPQLAGDNKPFDILTLDKKRKLQPLKLETLTPEEIHRSIMGWGRSTVYIRLKVVKTL